MSAGAWRQPGHGLVDHGHVVSGDAFTPAVARLAPERQRLLVEFEESPLVAQVEENIADVADVIEGGGLTAFVPYPRSEEQRLLVGFKRPQLAAQIGVGADLWARMIPLWHLRDYDTIAGTHDRVRGYHVGSNRDQSCGDAGETGHSWHTDTGRVTAAQDGRRCL